MGERFARKLKGGEVIGLNGELGAGKTVFVKGLAKGLGGKETIQSPTFILMRCYDSKPKLCHFDFYRLKTSEDALTVGIFDYWGKKDTVSVIEWAEKVKDLLPKNTRWIKFKYQDENERKIEFYDSRH